MPPALPMSLAEAARQLGITTDDVANPARCVRDLIRRHHMAYVRVGRTAKLLPSQVEALAEKMIVRPERDSPAPIDVLGIMAQQQARRVKRPSSGVPVPNPLAKTKRKRQPS